ncbi:phosphoglycerate mutase-like protein [Westerdykella ornata]|uniref:Phosphoglycerate mutase-like protein n=1 Tax=Westerdykella ornata TaxID=318751 RepID=A0A6A6JAZ1_WESOR|nr:phosphoglycerate mutase-like protein [Westerdykella ornata]KAF2272796.1 phosphoglycerate mutase-like protein [Westerdykella ornata]
MGSTATTTGLRLYLIRHGETVDNVGSVYAGRRDSELTSHGYQQAKRLGAYFHSQGIVFTHLFSSQLQRAAKTAAQIRDAQVTRATTIDGESTAPDVVHLPVLVEQDFGSLEGKKWNEPRTDAKSTGKEHSRQQHKEIPGLVNVESRDSMAQRADTFLDQHLLPLLDERPGSHVVAVVSHGIFLSVLWSQLLSRLPRNNVTLSSDVMASIRGYSLERLGGWSNTGYLELHVKTIAMYTAASAPNQSLTADPDTVHSYAKAQSGLHNSAPDSRNVAAKPFVDFGRSKSRLLHSWLVTIEAVNARDHLKGLKRTRGGIGSASHDASQQSIDRFFKKRKVE